MWTEWAKWFEGWARAWARYGLWAVGCASAETTLMLDAVAAIPQDRPIHSVVHTFAWCMLCSLGPLRPEAVRVAVDAVWECRVDVPHSHMAMICALAHAALLQTLGIDPKVATAKMGPLYPALIAAARHHPDNPAIPKLVSTLPAVQAYLVGFGDDVLRVRDRCQRIVDNPDDAQSVFVLAHVAMGIHRYMES